MKTKTIIISKSTLTIDISEGSSEVRENLVNNIDRDKSDNIFSSDMVLTFSSEDGIYFHTRENVHNAIRKLNPEILKAITTLEWADFADSFLDKVAVEVCSILEYGDLFDRYFHEIGDVIYDYISQNILEVTYSSFWDDTTELNSKALLDLNTGIVFDVEDNVTEGLEICDRESISVIFGSTTHVYDVEFNSNNDTSIKAEDLAEIKALTKCNFSEKKDTEAELAVELEMEFFEIARLGKDAIYAMIEAQIEEKYNITIELLEMDVNPIEIVVDDSNDYVRYEAIATDYKTV